MVVIVVIIVILHSLLTKGIVEARKLEHQYPHALKLEYRDPSTNPPKPMFQLSSFYRKESPSLNPREHSTVNRSNQQGSV